MICSVRSPGCRLISAAVIVLFACSLPAVAQPRLPAPPAGYQVTVRYRLYAVPTDRIALFNRLVAYLQSVGFHKNPGPAGEAEDPANTRMSGTIRVRSWEERHEIAAKMLADPHVKELQLVPTGLTLPANRDGRIQVGLELVSRYSLQRQRLLSDQVRAKLQQLGFIEAVGYDTFGHSRLVGSIPVGQLQTLQQDVRYIPAGWLVPVAPATTLPSPLRDGSPVLVSEVLRQPPARPVPPMFTPPQGQEDLLKLSPQVRGLALQQGRAPAQRLEVIFNYAPRPGEDQWRKVLMRAAPGTLIEGRLGELIAVRTPIKNAVALAQLPFVSAIRRPRPASSPMQPVTNIEDGTRRALQQSGLEQLHQFGHRGRGVRVAIIDDDFRGYQQFLGKKLPANVQYIDLTASRDPDVRPDPFPSPRGTIGAGTQRALAAALAAPEATLALIRIDPAAPYQLQTIARYVNGDNTPPESFQSRLDEFDATRTGLELRRHRLEEEQKAVENIFSDPKELAALESVPPERLRPDERERLNQLRRVDRYHKDRAALHRDEMAHAQRVGRFVALDRALKGLRGTNVLSCALIWEDGYPLGGDSALSRYFDDHPFRSAVWLQAAGNARDQSWSGLFQDIDGNGVLEFATVPVQRSQDWWKAELNFLSWRPAGKPRTVDLPAGIPIRVSLQWREAHDPDFFRTPGDPYLRPLAHLRVLVLRQLDPTGTKLPSDDFEVVAASEIPAQRLDNFPESATYEQSVVFTPDRPGRYAVRVEGTVPDDTRPPGAAVLPGQKVAWELRPRLFVDVADGRARVQGRPVLGSFAARTGSIGVPGDARTLLTVGAAALSGEPQPYATDGPPYNLRLLSKPDLLAYDAIQVGAGQPTAPTQSSLDTAFAAGMAATAISAGMPKPVISDAVHTRPGRVWKLR